MKRVKYIFLIWLMILPLVRISAQDTIVETVGSSQQIEDNLDSLLNLWYVKNSIKNYDNKIKAVADTQTIANVSDSVLSKRLGEIPSLIELPYNNIIRKYIEVYTRRKSAPVLLGLADFYFPMFEEILDKNDMPLELKYLPIIESALNPRAVSRAGATGLWQFMYGTGKMYQLEINSFVDERRDPFISTIAATRYLSHLYDLYGDWTLVIAAYNCGPGNVNKAIRRAKGKRDYWEIYPYLPRETRNYVPAFIGAAYLMNYYEKHEIKPLDLKMPGMTDTIMVDQKVHLQQIADVLKISIDELRDLNPQYKKDIIPAAGQSYPLRLPVEYSVAFIEMQDSIYKYKDTIFFNPRNVVITPQRNKKENYYAASYISEYDPPSTDNMTKYIYTVKEGDVLGVICDWYDVNIKDVRYWNKISRNTIRVGQNLIIYVQNKKAYKYKNINTASLEEKNKLSGNSANNKTSVNQPLVTDKNFEYYTVQKNDNPWTIAKKFGITSSDIMTLNNFSNADVKNLKPGQVIKIRKKG
ncbi:MAG: transglycosylase SLT domain-containing protein [Bacteroidales bacterium]